MEKKFIRRYESFKRSLDALAEAVLGSPKEVMKKSFQVKLIQDDVWLEMLKIRNELSHDYDGVIIKKACREIIGKYLDLFYEFKDTVDKLLGVE